ncbi:DNA-3-methyladenine glycosylase [Thalassoglobus neptunius]|uniref:DNA-3-methyladenine glycosylase II n=1 Tax=Thalassoglobus neptunius TaxID=1938619 RepID=A0A5C5X4Y6_9PLAN|nr:DNA-3-methyladenine glycosylase [Thalassoglobus neptunius]TWT58044.1 DNA-3-methyladenine glycosylase [Thalassoglobus neptunius]
MKPLDRDSLEFARLHLIEADPVLAELIHRVGPCSLKRQTNRYRNLLRAIVGQQISAAAAKSVFRRLEAAVETSTLQPESVAKLSDEQLRSVGLSSQKSRYIRDLTEHVLDGRLKLRSLHHRSDEEVIDLLTDVKGIGHWTAQMFLMFSLGRPDVLPWGDLGIQNAMKKLYQLDELPDRFHCYNLAEPWRPYSTVACLYLWKTID